MASVKFGKFKANRTGYSAVKNSSAVQGMLRGKAERVRSQAVSMAGGNGEVRGPARKHPKDIIAYPGSEYRKPPFVMKPVVLPKKGDHAYIVATGTNHGRYSEAKHKALSKSLGAARG